MDSGSASSFELQINELRKRVYCLEEALRRHGIAVHEEASVRESPLRAAVQDKAPEAVLTAVQRVDVLPAIQSHPVPIEPASPVRTDRSLESRIGSQWFNRIGILAVLISAAWFLKLAIDNQWIGPLGRVLIGLLAGVGLIAWSERFRSSGYAAFSYSLKAVGSGILYLSLWAGFSLFHLIPSSVAFASMILVTAFNGFMAWIQDAELLALYAIAGGLSTPLLLSEGGNHEVTLFSYLLLLDVAVLILVMLRPWSRLLFAGFLGTILFFTGWWLEYYSDSQSLRTGSFLTAFALIFAFGPRLIRLRPSAEGGNPSTGSSMWDNLALLVLPLINAALAFLAFYAILDRSATRWAEPWLAVIFAAFYLLLLRLPERGILHGSPEALSSIHLACAVVFLTIAIPLKAQGRWLTTGWLVEGAALLWVASRVQSRLLRTLAVLCLFLGLVALIAVNPSASLTPILNQRFATYCVAIAVFAFSARLAICQPAEGDSGDPTEWRFLGLTFSLIVNALILAALRWEIHNYWWFLRWRGALNELHSYRMDAQFSYSALFMAFGAILLAVGFWKRSAFVRWQALVLLAVAIGKVFLVDVSELSQGYRILSFLGLGALLLGVSFVYQRDWLSLRGEPSPATGNASTTRSEDPRRP